MQFIRTSRHTKFFIPALGTLCAVVLTASAQSQSNPPAEPKSQACPNDDSGLKLPAGYLVGRVLRQRHATRRRISGGPPRQERLWKG